MLTEYSKAFQMYIMNISCDDENTPNVAGCPSRPSMRIGTGFRTAKTEKPYVAGYGLQWVRMTEHHANLG
jgi:hypothetical protein